MTPACVQVTPMVTSVVTPMVTAGSEVTGVVTLVTGTLVTGLCVVGFVGRFSVADEDGALILSAVMQVS